MSTLFFLAWILIVIGAIGHVVGAFLALCQSLMALGCVLLLGLVVISMLKENLEEDKN